MNPIARFMRKLSILFRQERFASELDEEMTFHRTQVEEELIAGGMTPEAAHYAAMRQFGNASKLREQSHEVVAFRAETVVQDLRFALPVQGERVSGGFFKTLGVRPMLGRDFYPGENRPAGANVVLLSYGAWLRRFGGRRDVIGQTVDLDNASYTIIGVLPRTFTFAPSGNAEFWTPLNSFSTHEKMRTFYNFWGIGRLR